MTFAALPRAIQVQPARARLLDEKIQAPEQRAIRRMLAEIDLPDAEHAQ